MIILCDYLYFMYRQFFHFLNGTTSGAPVNLWLTRFKPHNIKVENIISKNRVNNNFIKNSISALE